jgi:hypothetical protein
MSAIESASGYHPRDQSGDLHRRVRPRHRDPLRDQVNQAAPLREFGHRTRPAYDTKLDSSNDAEDA